MRLEKVLETLKKYRCRRWWYWRGVVLMLLPTGTKTDKAEDTAEDEGFSPDGDGAADGRGHRRHRRRGTGEGNADAAER